VSVQKIKNLILLILALAVVFLTLLVIPTKTAQAREETALHDRLETLFSENGVQLDGSALPQSLRLYTISLDGIPQAAGSAVSVLLGSSAEVQDDTVRYSSVYTSARGACSVTANGAFSASLDGSLAYSDPVAGTKKLLRSMGFTAAAVSEAARKSAGVYAVTATQQILGVPVFSDGLTFTYTNGALESVEGVFFPGLDLHPRERQRLHLLRRRARGAAGLARFARLGRQQDHPRAAGLRALRHRLRRRAPGARLAHRHRHRLLRGKRHDAGDHRRAERGVTPPNRAERPAGMSSAGR
jgi:hypothetical protein